MRELTEEELKEQRAKARMRSSIKGLFSEIPEVRLEALDALKEAWSYDEPSFRTDELASAETQSAVIAAARRDGYKEIIAWLSKI